MSMKFFPVKNRQSETSGMLAILYYSKRFLSMLGNFSHMLANWLPAASQRLMENFRHFWKKKAIEAQGRSILLANKSNAGKEVDDQKRRAFLKNQRLE